MTSGAPRLWSQPESRGWVGLRRTRVLRDAADARHVLHTHEDRYETIPRLLGRFLRLAAGPSAVTARRAEAATHRGVIRQGIHARHLPYLGERIRARTRRTADAWLARGWMAPLADFRALGSEVILDLVLGAGWEEQDPGLARLALQRQAAFEAAVTGVIPWDPRTLADRWQSRSLDKRFAAVADRLSPGDPCVLGWMLSDSADSRLVRQEAFGLLWSGRAAVAKALAWAWLELARDATSLDRAAAEARERRDDAPYLTAVIRETLRLHPPSERVMRVAQSDDVLPAGGRVRSGATVSISIADIHRARDHAAAERFDPGRFLDSQVDQRAYMPFGLGKRVCPGRGLAVVEMAAVLGETLGKLRPSNSVSWSASDHPLDDRLPIRAV